MVIPGLVRDHGRGVGHRSRARTRVFGVNGWGVVNMIGGDSAVVDKLARLTPKRVGYVMAMMVKRAGIEVTDT